MMSSTTSLLLGHRQDLLPFFLRLEAYPRHFFGSIGFFRKRHPLVKNRSPIHYCIIITSIVRLTHHATYAKQANHASTTTTTSAKLCSKCRIWIVCVEVEDGDANQDSFRVPYF
jgi:hypothetical protein